MLQSLFCLESRQEGVESGNARSNLWSSPYHVIFPSMLGAPDMLECVHVLQSDTSAVTVY